MYVDVSTVRRGARSYTRFLLRESFRDKGHVKHRTIANLSHCSPQEIEAIRLALRHKENLCALQPTSSPLVLKQGPAFGAVWLVHEVARSLGIAHALGNTREGKLALWQVLARVLNQGSRLSAVRLASVHAACDVLGLESFDEDDLYANLDWLTTQQAEIEQKLFQARPPASAPGLFLYDVTSSYLEGQDNAFGAFGYSRDGKRRKRQIVIGLLCDSQGQPLSIEVFPGNTQDLTTFSAQIDKVAQRFGGGAITFVGDRGMIKTPQINALGDKQFHYITAITKPQIEALLTRGIFQMTLFDQPLAEITTPHGARYILRRNPLRAQEIAAAREDKYRTLGHAVAIANQYLTAHPRAKATRALEKLTRRAHQLRIAPWTTLTLEQRTLKVERNTSALAESAELDGCYVLKTDLPASAAPKELIHERYKDLALVEWAFRESNLANAVHGHAQARVVAIPPKRWTR